MKSLWPLGTVTLLALAVMTQLPAAAMEEEPAFVVLFTDPADDQGTGVGGYYDVLEGAVAEPGDDTLLLRVTVADATDFVDAGGVRSVGSIRVDFRINGATSYQVTISTAGESASDDHAESCSVDGNQFLCIIDYESIAAKVGDKVTDLNVASRVLNEADSATGDEYTLAGSTAADADAGTDVETETLTGDNVEIEENFTASTNKTAVYTWNNTSPAVTLTYDITVQTGGIGIKVDVNNTTLLETAVSETGNGTVPIQDAAQGEWTITLTYADFTGAIGLSVAPLDAGNGIPDGTTETNTTVEGPDLDDKETKDSSSLALLPALGVLGLVALMGRRRTA